MSAIFEDITAAVGYTPLVRINKLGTSKATILAKLESFNPAGSVKDRIALSMIEAAEKQGLIKDYNVLMGLGSYNPALKIKSNLKESAQQEIEFNPDKMEQANPLNHQYDKLLKEPQTKTITLNTSANTIQTTPTKTTTEQTTTQPEQPTKEQQEAISEEVNNCVQVKKSMNAVRFSSELSKQLTDDVLVEAKTALDLTELTIPECAPLSDDVDDIPISEWMLNDD